MQFSKKTKKSRQNISFSLLLWNTYIQGRILYYELALESCSKVVLRSWNLNLLWRIVLERTHIAIFLFKALELHFERFFPSAFLRFPFRLLSHTLFYFILNVKVSVLENASSNLILLCKARPFLITLHFDFDGRSI